MQKGKGRQETGCLVDLFLLSSFAILAGDSEAGEGIRINSTAALSRRTS